MLELLKLAGKIAPLPNPSLDKRSFILGAVGIRRDGAMVMTRNGAVSCTSTVDDYRIISDAHAEVRNIRQLGKDAKAIYVARILKLNGHYAMSAPCEVCQMRIIAARVKRVYYTINNTQYGVWDVARDEHRVYNT